MFARVAEQRCAAPARGPLTQLRGALTTRGTLVITGSEPGQVTPVIDRTYQPTNVPAASRYLPDGHVRGKVIVSI